MEKMKEILKDVLDEPIFQDEVKDLLKKKIKEALVWDFTDQVKEMIDLIFDEKYKAELFKILTEEKESIRKKFRERIKETLNKAFSEVDLEISSWQLKELIKQNLVVKEGE